MKLFSETVNQNPEDSKSEKINAYDQPASEKEIVGFKEEIEKVIEEKAKALNISKEKVKLILPADGEVEFTASKEKLEVSKLSPRTLVVFQ